MSGEKNLKGNLTPHETRDFWTHGMFQHSPFLSLSQKMFSLEHWPPHSADLNPIEQYVVDEFNKVSDNVVERLVTSFERRVESVVKVRGAQLV